MKARWQPDEIDYVRRNAGRKPLRTIARKLKRTPVSVEEFIDKAMGTSIYRMVVGKDMTSPEIAAELGISRSVVNRWLLSGELTARRVILRKREIYTVKRIDLREFILRGGLIDNTSHPRSEWLSAVIDGKRLWHDAHIDSIELARLLGLSRINFSAHLRHYKQFPRPVRSKGRAPAYFRRTDIRAWLNANPQYWTSAARDHL